ncbi:pilin [Isoalcanivorax indicus]|uniref:pilin n=1 Tax=Isoalcanivorax indicus TaxID=2202653 RepID=UPI001FE65FBB
MYIAEEAALPDAGDSASLDQALADLEGKYFGAGNASLTGPGTISVAFQSGVHAGETMTLEAIPNAANNQIARWECDGLDPKYLPAACRP